MRRGEPIRARRTGALERGWSWCRRNPRLAAAVAATAASLALVVALSLTIAIQQARSVEKLRQEREKLRQERGKTNEALVRLVREQGHTSVALKNVEIERDRANRESRKAFQSLSEFYMERGRALADGGDAKGLHWAARALAAAPADDAALQHAIRAGLSVVSRQTNMPRVVFPCPGPVVAVAFSPDG